VQRIPPFKKNALITCDDIEETEPQESKEANMSLIAKSDDEEANMCLMAQSDDEEDVIIYKAGSLYKAIESKMDSLL